MISKEAPLKGRPPIRTQESLIAAADSLGGRMRKVEPLPPSSNTEIDSIGAGVSERAVPAEIDTLGIQTILLIPCGGSSGPDKVIASIKSHRRDFTEWKTILGEFRIFVAANEDSFAPEKKVLLAELEEGTSLVQIIFVQTKGFGDTLHSGLRALRDKYLQGTSIIFEDDGLSSHQNYAGLIGKMGKSEIVVKSRRLSCRFDPHRPPSRLLFTLLDIMANKTLGLPQDAHLGAGKLGVLPELFEDLETGGWVTEKEVLLRAKKKGIDLGVQMIEYQDDPRSAAGNTSAIKSAFFDYLKIIKKRLKI